ncbi:MAG TPA: hypothetical protein GXX24_16000 [Paracoccus solventivorans]|uniref:F-type H+-transporting ATPase subunit gamma n=1 Tax=Paracoccus solventivorans TaxID=53463 RepID=A0A832PQJ3_9RHOB|nr:F0F1 ATP synthase subunit gamma [Paracoccus solventivorans]HHW35617.1 hypothetical protein [Paracoccus solventivorans]
MATLEELSRRIGSAEDLQSVVRTMKATSAANIRVHEQAERAMRGHLRTVEMGLQVVLRELPDPALAPPPAPGEAAAVVVIGSEIGLCGSFNERLVDFARARLAALGIAPGSRLVLTVGTTLAGSWEAAESPPDLRIEAPATIAALAPCVADILSQLDLWREERGAGRVLLFCHRSGDSLSAAPEQADLLPLDPGWLRELRNRRWGSRRLPRGMGETGALLGSLVRQLLFARLHLALIQSRAAENIERLVAMQAADSSIAEKLEEMQVSYRLSRQAAISAELLDLIAGYQAATGE